MIQSNDQFMKLDLTDLLILPQNPAELRQQFQLVMNLLANLGFKIKLEKCSSAPTRVVVFLGACLNSTNMSISVPQEKLILQSECQTILKARHCSMQQLAALLGQMNHATLIGIWKGPLYYRALQRQYIGLTRMGSFKASKKYQLVLTKQALQKLEWWSSTQLLQHNQVSVIFPPFGMTIWTDASKKGWGAAYLDQKTGGQWAMDAEKAHINVLKLKAAYLVIQSFVKDMKSMPCHILILMDNSTAVCYVSKKGGTRSPQLVSLATEIWNFCLGRNIWIAAKHVSGVENVDADFASRQFHNHTEWTLDRKIFRQINPALLSSGSGSIRVEDKQPAPEVHSQVSRSRIDCDGRVPSEQVDPIHPSSGCFTQGLTEDMERPSDVIVNSPSMEKATLVPHLAGTVDRSSADHIGLPMTETTIYLPFDPQVTHPLWKTLS